MGNWDWLGGDGRGLNVRKDYFHFNLYTVRTEMCEFIFACMILDLAQSELTRESNSWIRVNTCPLLTGPRVTD